MTIDRARPGRADIGPVVVSVLAGYSMTVTLCASRRGRFAAFARARRSAPSGNAERSAPLGPVVSENPTQAMIRDLVFPSKSYPTLGATG
jgi:hypothetical protein